MNLHKILCPTDFSLYNEAALKYASALAAESGATLVIAHVDEYRDANAALGEAALNYMGPLGMEDRSEVRTKLEEVKPTNSRVVYEHRYLEGGPIHEIVAFAEREHVDLIVMGSHGRTGLSRLLMGSVAEGVARRAACPVLIVKQPVPETPEVVPDDAMVLQE
ncbi:MAG: universal stress protein [Pirellulales bacterium]